MCLRLLNLISLLFTKLHRYIITQLPYSKSLTTAYQNKIPKTYVEDFHFSIQASESQLLCAASFGCDHPPPAALPAPQQAALISRVPETSLIPFLHLFLKQPFYCVVPAGLELAM